MRSRRAGALTAAVAAAALAPPPAHGVRPLKDAATAAKIHTERIGRSVRGVPIRAYRVGPANAARTVLVVGEIHGNERAGEAVARRMFHVKPPPGMAFWIVPELNPDGARANTRQNANGVDLNRNFGYRWRPLDHRGGTYWSGTGPFSAPESRAAKRLILRIRPRIAVWYHQHLALVDESSGGDVHVESRYARLVGLPAKHLPRYSGTATQWANHHVTHGTEFVVELPAGSLSDADQHRHAVAILRLARATEPGR